MVAIIGLVGHFALNVNKAEATVFPISICHHTPSNEVTHTFQNLQSYLGHLGTPHSGSTYDTQGACAEPTATPTPTPECFENECNVTPTPTEEVTPTATPSATPTVEVTTTSSSQGGDGLSDGRSDGRSSSPQPTLYPEVGWK